NESSYAGLSVAAFTGPTCSQFNMTPPEIQRFQNLEIVDNTSAPILFINSIADPITPLASARKMHGLFPGSGLLVFNNSGVRHTAHFQNVTCMSKYEMQYMFDGTLPPAKTTCEVDEPNPWIYYAKQSNFTQQQAQTEL
ncbi:hypothetical protein EJ02DRAFT_354001, partial [Clathrospora elynae]